MSERVRVWNEDGSVGWISQDAAARRAEHSKLAGVIRTAEKEAERKPKKEAEETPLKRLMERLMR